MGASPLFGYKIRHLPLIKQAGPIIFYQLSLDTRFAGVRQVMEKVQPGECLKLIHRDGVILQVVGGTVIIFVFQKERYRAVYAFLDIYKSHIVVGRHGDTARTGVGYYVV